MASDAGPGVEGHEAEGLGGRGIDCLPYVDAKFGGEDGQFVDQGNVDVPKGIFEELRSSAS